MVCDCLPSCSEAICEAAQSVHLDDNQRQYPWWLVRRRDHDVRRSETTLQQTKALNNLFQRMYPKEDKHIRSLDLGRVAGFYVKLRFVRLDLTKFSVFIII